MTNALVTGGAGFIGSHVVDALIARGYKTLVVDDLYSGHKEYVHPKARFYQMDIGASELKDIFAAEKIDWVFHLAAQIDVRKSVDDPQFDARVNILGLLNLLENCCRYQVKGVIFSSSVAIHGEPASLPVLETMPKGPFAPYGVSKLTSEYYLYYYHRVHNLPYAALRYSNVYGPRQDTGGEGGVVAIFTGRMLKGETCTIFGNGEQTRDYVFVEDIARANLAAIDKMARLPQADSIDDRAFNIATHTEISVNELFMKLKEITDFKGKASYAAERPGELKRSFLDIHKAGSGLGWKPSVTLSEGLKRTVDYWRKEK